MGRLFKDLLINNENELYFDKADLSELKEVIRTKYVKSELLFNDLDTYLQFKVIDTLKSRKKRHNKSVFLKDFENYVGQTCSKINKDVLTEFYKFYRDQDSINTDEFIWSLKHYLHSENIWDSSYDLVCAIEAISTDKNLFDAFLNANLIYRYVKNAYLTQSTSYFQTYKGSPIRYILHMYFDLVSTVKRANDNNDKNEFQSIIFNNFYKINQNEKRKLHRSFTLLN